MDANTPAFLCPAAGIDLTVEQTAQTGRYSKRKRQQVKYYDSEDDDIDDPVDSDDEKPRSKKPKTQRSNSKPLPKKEIFPFMSLPPELRNRIYEVALSDSAGHYLVKTRSSWRRTVARMAPSGFRALHANWWKRRRQSWFYYHYMARREENASENESTAINATVPPFKKLCITVLMLSKTIYDEAIGFIYSKQIILSDTYALHSFLVQIGPKHRALLRNLEVCEWGQTGAHGAMNFPAMSCLADAVNLERLKLNVDKDGSSKLAQKVWRDCYPFFEAYGFAKGRKDAAVDILELYDKQFQQKRYNYQTRLLELTNDKEEFEKDLRQKLKSR